MVNVGKYTIHGFYGLGIFFGDLDPKFPQIFGVQMGAS